jgi:hypothetical protein
MTSLAKRKTRLSVEFSDTVREQGKHREITMDFSPYAVSVRLKGLRSSFLISPAAIYHCAVRLSVNQAVADKKAKKARRR